MKKLGKILTILCLVVLITGCKLLKPRGNNSPTVTPTKEKVTITTEEIEKMEKANNAIFDVEKDSLKISDLTDAERGAVARKLVVYFQSKTGTEMTKEFQNYFGEDQNVVFEDVPCFAKHNSEEEQILYIFDKEQDKYVTNEKHPGHGGGGKSSTQYMMSLDSIEVEGDTYTYSAKVLFYGPFWCYDVGGCNYGKAYKNAEDAKNETNPLVDIAEKYTMQNVEGPPQMDMDKLMEDYKDKVDTYQFIFEKEEGNLIFKEYKKA